MEPTPEMALLGLCLRDPLNLERCLSLGISCASFENPSHSAIWDKLCELTQAGHTEDLFVKAGMALREHAVQLVKIEAQAPVGESVDFYAVEVLEAAFARVWAEKFAVLSARARARRPFDEQPLRPILLEALAELERGPDSSRGPVHMQRAVTDALGEIEEILTGNDRRPVKTGFQVLDRSIMSLRPGFHYVFAARTGVGKTTMAMQMALNAARDGRQVLFVTVEQPYVDLTIKALGSLARLPIPSILTGQLNDEERDRLMHASRELYTLPMTFDDSSRSLIASVEMTAHRLKRQGKLDVIFVDYLQLFRASEGRRHENRTAELTEISWRLKELSKALAVPVVSLAQLNRKGAEEDEPYAHHIRDCGSIEQDADMIAMIHKHPDEGYRLLIRKNRRGPETVIPMTADLAIGKFFEVGE